MGSRSAIVSLVLGSGLLFGACAVDTTDADTTDADTTDADTTDADTTDAEDRTKGLEENVESTEQAIYSGWTSFTSEEYPPIICDSASLMNSFQCSGSYCDNIRAYCQPTSGSLGSSYWTSYFSEEGTNYRFCNPGFWVTGLSCTGGYCDNISLQCSYIGNKTPVSCYWTGWISEENGGTLSFGNGYYMRGAQCNGSNCDNMRFYVCQTGSTAGTCSASTCSGSAGGCWCDASCLTYGDCCANACSACGRCG
jgi:hypothetical protein